MYIEDFYRSFVPDQAWFGPVFGVGVESARIQSNVSSLLTILDFYGYVTKLCNNASVYLWDHPHQGSSTSSQPQLVLALVSGLNTTESELLFEEISLPITWSRRGQMSSRECRHTRTRDFPPARVLGDTCTSTPSHVSRGIRAMYWPPRLLHFQGSLWERGKNS